MAKSIKDKLKEQQAKNHDEFRKQLVRDVHTIFQKWGEHLSGQMQQREKALEQTTHKLSQMRRQVEQVNSTLRSIKSDTIQEVQALKQGRSWKFLLCCYLCALMGSLTGIIICGMYWPAIRSLLS